MSLGVRARRKAMALLFPTAAAILRFPGTIITRPVVAVKTISQTRPLDVTAASAPWYVGSVA